MPPPGFYRYTDHDGDTLDISPALSDQDGTEVPAVAIVADPHGIVHVTPDRVPEVIAAIRTAAGLVGPETWQQCPDSEFDGYGLQCQKEAGHNLCTFEQQGGATPDPGPS
ncbi:hypothetical protein ACWF94_03615 [Streptomyces sp. NPDC055078]